MGYGPFEHILASQEDGGVLVLTLNRPRIKNAWGSLTYLEVAEVLRTAKDDETVHVVIFTGAGSFFSSGADFTSPADTPLDHATVGMNARHKPVGVFMLEMMRFPKPIIAAVNGPAVGVGVTLLLHADIIYCTEDAYFWTPFSRIAVVPEFVSSLLLREIIGQSLSNEMLLANRQLTAREAKESGLVSAIHPSPAAVLAAAKATAAHMLSFPLATDSLPLYKRLIRSPARMRDLEHVFLMEMDELTARIERGDPAVAAVQYLQSRGKTKSAL